MQSQEIQERRFATAFRGYDPGEVRQFLAHVAGLYADLQGRVVAADERVRLVSNSSTEPGSSGSPAPSGSSGSSGLSDDGDVAPALTLAEVEDLRMQAERQAVDLVAAARAEAQTIVSRANDEAARVVLRARAESRGKPSAERSAAIEAALAEVPVDPEQARDQARLMITEARAVRERILGDLAKRRRTAHVQLEQLRVAREKLLETLRDARRVVEDASRDLSTAEVEARLAAETAGRRVASEPVPTVEELEAELFGGRFLTSSTSSGRPLVADRAAVPDTSVADVDDMEVADAAVADAVVVTEVETHVVADAEEMAGVKLVAEAEAAADVERVGGVETDVVPDVGVVEMVDVSMSPDAGVDHAVSETLDLPEVAEMPVDPAVRAGSVDDLFARLRAERTEAADQARVLLAATPTIAKRSRAPRTTKASVVDRPSTDTTRAGDANDMSVVVIDVTSADATDTSNTTNTTNTTDATGDLGQNPHEIADLVAQRLARSVKRHLRDEQGSALVALRTARGVPVIDALLGTSTDHRDRLHNAVGAALIDAGSRTTTEHLREMIDEICLAIRADFAAALEQVGVGAADAADLPERIAGTYRVWTIERLDVMIRHQTSVAA